MNDPDDRATHAEEQPRMVQVRLPSSRAIGASYGLLGLNIAIYVLTCLLSANLFAPSSGVLALGWKQNDLIRTGEYWRLLSAMFLHGNLVHIFFNGYALFALGPETERIYGTGRFVTLYMLAGLSGSLASYAFSRAPSVGASGAIFGLIGALAVFYLANRRVLGEFGSRQLQSMVAVIAVNLMIGFSAGGVIDNFAHLGGLIGGSVLGWLLAPRFVLAGSYAQPRLDRHFLAASWAGTAVVVLLIALAALLIRPPV